MDNDVDDDNVNDDYVNKKINEYCNNDYCDVCAMWDPISDDNLSSLDPSTADQTNQKT